MLFCYGLFQTKILVHIDGCEYNQSRQSPCLEKIFLIFFFFAK